MFTKYLKLSGPVFPLPQVTTWYAEGGLCVLLLLACPDKPLHA